MIHYHGTPIGGPNADKARFYQGRHACVSYAHPDDLEVVCECCQSYFVDNGAFSFWRSGKAVDWDGYMEWIDQLPRHPDFYLIPDIIGGTELENRNLVFKYGRKHGAVPVYHLHESMEYLDFLCNNYGMVAIGSSGQWPNPGTNSWWARMEEVMSVCCDSNGRPRVKLHGLRMLDPAIFTLLPLYSADSTNVARNNNQINRFGMYVPPDAGRRACVIADRVEVHQSIDFWHRQEQMQLWD